MKTYRCFLAVLICTNFLVSSVFADEEIDFSDLKGREPLQWAEVLPGVQTHLPEGTKAIALTMDACGSSGDSYDKEIIEYLRKHRIQATLFINARWIDKYPDIFADLASDPLFEIGNHGLNHKPCSVNGKSIYDIKGTVSIDDVVREVQGGSEAIEEASGIKPHYYRSGTAYYDEVAVEVVHRLGQKIAGFSVLGDKGTTASAEEVFEAVTSAKNGDIIICHFNHPERETAEGLLPALDVLRERNVRFVKLSE